MLIANIYISSMQILTVAVLSRMCELAWRICVCNRPRQAGSSGAPGTRIIIDKSESFNVSFSSFSHNERGEISLVVRLANRNEVLSLSVSLLLTVTCVTSWRRASTNYLKLLARASLAR